MRCVMVSLVVALCLSAAAPVPAQTPAVPPGPPTIVTIGSATIRVAPDRAFVTVTTEATAPSPAAAQQRIAESMTGVRAKVKAARVPDDAVKTTAYSLQEDVVFENNRRVSKGYRAQNAIEVRIDEIARVGEVIDAAVQGGATAVSDIRFDLKDRDAVERQALKQAVVDARARADALAAGAGVTIASVLRVDEQGRAVPVPRPVPMMAMRTAAMDAGPATPVSAGEIEVQVTVTLTVAIR